MRAVVGLGTNLGDRIGNLRAATAALDLLMHTRVLRRSSVYESKPYGYAQQGDFLNMAIELETDLPPEGLLGALLGVEAALGRVRQFKNGPRVIDLDLLLAEGYTSDTPFLRVPHPGISERSFVLYPLNELFPAGTAYGFSFRAAFQGCTGADISLYGALSE